MARTQEEIIHLMKNGFELKRFITDDDFILNKQRSENTWLVDKAHKSSVLSLVKKGVIRKTNSSTYFDYFELCDLESK